MAKRVFIIHGWKSYPEDAWFPWLKKELEKRGFLVEIPSMPESSYPKIETWVPFIAKLVNKTDKDTYFIGHSIGCQAIMRYLQSINGNIGGAIFVGGWISLTLVNRTKERIEMIKPWLETPIDFGKIKKITRNFVAILSDNDPYVPLENLRTYKEKLNARVIIEKQKGHFSRIDNIKEIPVLLEALLKIVK